MTLTIYAIMPQPRLFAIVSGHASTADWNFLCLSRISNFISSVKSGINMELHQYCEICDKPGKFPLAVLDIEASDPDVIE